MGLRDIKVPKMKFKKMKMDVMEELNEIDYEKLEKKNLKKKRAISKLEFFIPEYEYRRLKKMKDPIETLERPVEHMTVYRNDGSSVTLTAENGRVSIVDSREKNVRHIILFRKFCNDLLQIPLMVSVCMPTDI